MKRLRYLLVHACLLFFTGLVLFPVLKVIQIALRPGKAFDLSLNPFPTQFSLINFSEVMGRTVTIGGEEVWLFGHQLFNSIVVSVATSIVGMFLACTAAYAFSRFRFPGRQAGLMSFLVTQMFPGTMMMIPLFILAQTLGLLDQLLGLVLVYSTTAIPFCVWTLKGYFDTIPRELEEAAIIDGASRVRVFWQIILPLAKPALAVTALFSFMTAWNEFILAATFMNQEVSYTLPVMLRQFVGEREVDWGHFAAGAIIVSVPIMALFFTLQKYLVSGLTAGAVKG